MLRKASNFLSQINEVVGRATAWLTAILMILMCYNVLQRYFFNNIIAWRTELEWHIFGLIFLLGAGYALKHDKHVRVDVFYANFSKKNKAWVNVIGTLLFLLPWCILIIIMGYKFAYTAFEQNEFSPNDGLPYRFLIKSAIPIGFFFLLIQGLVVILESLATILEKEKTPDLN